MKNSVAIALISFLCLLMQTTVLAEFGLLMQNVVFLRHLFSSIYINLLLIVLSYLALTRKPFEAFVWCFFLYTMSRSFGVAWGSSLSINYIFLTMFCISIRQRIFMTGYTQKFFFGFMICIIALFTEHLIGGIFQRKDGMFLGLWSVFFSQSFLCALVAPILFDLQIWLDKKTLSKLKLHELNIIFSKQRENFIATF